MADNLIAQGGLWTTNPDSVGYAMTPAEWTGTYWESLANVDYFNPLVTVPADGDYLSLHLINHKEMTVQSGAYVDGVWTPNPPSTVEFIVAVNYVVLARFPLHAGAEYDYASGPLQAGAVVQMGLYNPTGSPVPDTGPFMGTYTTGDWEMHPTSPVPPKFWTDFVGCSEVN